MLRSPYICEWWTETNLGAGANMIVGVAGDEIPVASIDYIQCADVPRFRFGLFCDQPLEIQVQVSLDAATWRVQLAATALASVFFDPYALPAPIGDSGYLWLQGPYVRLRLENKNAGVAATDTYFWAQVF